MLRNYQLVHAYARKIRLGNRGHKVLISAGLNHHFP
jgi:hypothetical protein